LEFIDRDAAVRADSEARIVDEAEAHPAVLAGHEAVSGVDLQAGRGRDTIGTSFDRRGSSAALDTGNFRKGGETAKDANTAAAKIRRTMPPS
jgi:hypothetical protein